MHRQAFDIQLTQYADRGWRATFFTSGMEHSLIGRTGSAWEPTAAAAVIRAACKRCGTPKPQREEAADQLAPPRAGRRGAAYHLGPADGIRIADRFIDETGESKIVGRPFTMRGDKAVHGKVRRAGYAGSVRQAIWPAHKCVRGDARNVNENTNMVGSSLTQRGGRG